MFSKLWYIYFFSLFVEACAFLVKFVLRLSLVVDKTVFEVDVFISILLIIFLIIIYGFFVNEKKPRTQSSLNIDGVVFGFLFVFNFFLLTGVVVMNNIII